MAKYQDNELDKFTNVAYHFKFYMIPEHEFLNGKKTSDSEIIIAQSGVTSQVVFESVNFESFVAPDNKTLNMYSNRFNIRLREQAGAKLLDSIFLSATEIGIKNYYKAPYFLELSFRGYDNDGNPRQAELNQRKYIWPVTIVKVETEVDIGGTSYDIQAYHTPDIAQLDENQVLRSTVNINNVETVGDALGVLKDRLNEQAIAKALDHVTLPDTYNFEVNPEINNFKLVDDDPDIQNERQNENAGTNSNTRTFNIDGGTTVLQAINEILISSTEYQKFAKNSNTSGDDKSTDPNKRKRIHTVATETQLVKYDIMRGDYQKAFTFKISPYDIALAVTPDDQNASSKQYAQELINKNQLVKAYYYHYTGKSDQIINFDLKFNFGWYAQVPHQGGITSGTESLPEGHYITERQWELLNIKEEIAKAAANLSSDTAPDVSAKQQQIVSQKIQEAENLTDGEKAQLENLLKAQINARVKPAGSRNAEENNFDSNISRNGSQFAIDRKVEDLDSVKTPISFVGVSKEEYQKYVKRSKAPTSDTEGSARVSAMFSQAFKGIGTSAGDLVNIDLEIRGDWYWLGDPENDKPVNQPSNNVKEFRGFDSQNYFLLEINSVQDNGNDESVYTTTNTLGSGVYGVIKVEHNFENGMFTQRLYAYRIPFIQHKDAKE